MNVKKHVKYYLLVLFSVLILCSCTRPPEGNSGSGDITAENQPTQKLAYDQYDEELLKTQTRFDEFTRNLFIEEVQNSTIDLHFQLYDPSAYGIEHPNVTLGDFSLESMAQDTLDMEDLKKELESFNQDYLSKDQLLTYRMLEDYLETSLKAAGLDIYYQPLSPTIGVQAQLPVLLSEYQFYRKQDVEDYLTLLSQIDDYYRQIMDFEQARARAGLTPSDVTLDRIIQSCNSYMVRPENLFLTETFAEKLSAMKDVTEEEKADYIERHTQAVKEHFIPAYQLLVDGLTAMKGTGVNDYGLAHYERGKEYYAYLVAAYTGTAYTVEELKAAIEEQRNEDLASISQILRENPGLIDQLDGYEFSVTEPKDILENLKSQIDQDFPPLPECNYTVKYVPNSLESVLSPAFYLVPPIDRYTDNVIYINRNEDFSNADLYTTLAHEGYPGHLYQNVYNRSHNPYEIRSMISCSGYSEGWATYVENYAYTLDNGLDKDLGRLLAYNNSATLSIYALLDINVNYDGWDLEQAKDFLNQYYNIQDEEVIKDVYYAVVDNPANYLEYYTGYLEILNMRKQAENVLKERFDLKRFHKFILDMGPTTFRVIRPYFKAWLMSYNALS